MEELAANGTESVGFRAPDDVTTSTLWTLPGGDGTSGQVLQTDGSGALSWTAAGSDGDFKADGSVAMTGNIELGSNYLSGDGDNEGIFVDSDGNIGVGTTTPSAPFQLWGNQAMKIGFHNQGWEFYDDSTNSVIKSISNGFNLHISRLGSPALFNDFKFTHENISGFEEIMRLEGEGNLGIGDSGPDAHLEVSANGGSGGAAFMVSADDSGDGDLFTVQEDGNVGIGTTSPSKDMHLYSCLLYTSDAADE